MIDFNGKGIDMIILKRVAAICVIWVMCCIAIKPLLAGPYLEIGAYVHHETYDSIRSEDSDNGKWRNPLGKVEVGWAFDGRLEGLSFGATHYSSMQERDSGLNMIGIQWRWE